MTAYEWVGVVLIWTCIGIAWYELRILKQMHTAHSMRINELQSTVGYLSRMASGPAALQPTTYMPPLASGMILTLGPADPRYTAAPPSHPQVEEANRWEHLDLGRNDGVQKEVGSSASREDQGHPESR